MQILYRLKRFMDSKPLPTTTTTDIMQVDEDGRFGSSRIALRFLFGSAEHDVVFDGSQPRDYAKPTTTTATNTTTSTNSLDQNESNLKHLKQNETQTAYSTTNGNQNDCLNNKTSSTTSTSNHQTQQLEQQPLLVSVVLERSFNNNNNNNNNNNDDTRKHNLDNSAFDIVEHEPDKKADNFVASKQTTNRIDSCKKFLVKKLSGSKSRLLGRAGKDKNKSSYEQQRKLSRKTSRSLAGGEESDISEKVNKKYYEKRPPSYNHQNKSKFLYRIATSLSDSAEISQLNRQICSSYATSSSSSLSSTTLTKNKRRIFKPLCENSLALIEAANVATRSGPHDLHTAEPLESCEREKAILESERKFSTSEDNEDKTRLFNQRLDLSEVITPISDLLHKTQDNNYNSRFESNISNYNSMMETVLINSQPTNVGEIEGGVSTVSQVMDAAKTCSIASKRLRDLVAHLEHGSVPQSVLYQTLEYAASVLDSVAMDQISRVSDEEDGDLSEVQSDAVPNEVRKWLETTFTRNSISQKRKSEDKLKFRSVANAIRAGIVVDRIYRRTSACTTFVSAEVSQLLKSIDHWSFDCFSVNQVSNGQVLKSVGYELFNRYGLMYKFKIPTTILKNFLSQIELGYVKHKNPYHNNLHAADVTQTVHYMLWQAGLTNWLSDLEIFATLLAAIIHDYLHTGTTNNFHVMSQSDTALLYNDRAVLENFHICQAFTLMKNEDCNILAGLSKDEYREFRSLVIDMVLATDMSSHFQQIKAMKNILNHSDNFSADKSKILSLVIHISDISHPAKEWEIHQKWTQLLMEEFFRQGDREKELQLECSPLCDRETTLVAESQLGFIEFIVSPSLEVCGDVLDRVHYQMAEANARPVLPASAKASLMAAAGNAKQSTAAAAIEAAPSGGGGDSDKRRDQSEQQEQNNQQQQTGSGSSGQRRRPPPLPPKNFSNSPASQHVASSNQQLPSTNTSSRLIDSSSSTTPTSTTSQSSLVGSFVSSESLTSNLRKMIVSSSVSLGRKFNNITGSNTQAATASSSTSSSSTAASTNAANQQQPPPFPSITRASISGVSGGSTTNSNDTKPHQMTPQTDQQAAATMINNNNSAAAASDFETRQANYRHPVIQAERSSAAAAAAAGGLRPRSAQAGGYRVQQHQQQHQQRSSAGPTGTDTQADNPNISNNNQSQHQLHQSTEATAASDQLTCVSAPTNTNQHHHAPSSSSSSGGSHHPHQTHNLLAPQPTGLASKRNSISSGQSSCSQGSSQAGHTFVPFKISRPWISCLERNKKIWHERAIVDAQAREFKEKLKAQQLESSSQAQLELGTTNVAISNHKETAADAADSS